MRLWDETLYRYAMSFVGTPYRWGGDDPILGFDCSGFVLELLQSAGEIGPGTDMSARAIFNHFTQAGKGSVLTGPCFGALAFFGESTTKISHVGFCIDPYRMIDSGGGTSDTTSLEAAIKQNAFIRIRPLTWRKDCVGFVKPRYAGIGAI